MVSAVYADNTGLSSTGEIACPVLNFIYGHQFCLLSAAWLFSGFLLFVEGGTFVEGLSQVRHDSLVLLRNQGPLIPAR